MLLLVSVQSMLVAWPALLSCWLVLVTTQVPAAAARRHHLFVGNLHRPAVIHSLVFDEDTLQLNVTRSLAADSSQSWLTFNVCFLSSLSLSLSRQLPKLLDIHLLDIYIFFFRC